jgi:hypothetical protein
VIGHKAKVNSALLSTLCIVLALHGSLGLIMGFPGYRGLKTEVRRNARAARVSFKLDVPLEFYRGLISI